MGIDVPVPTHCSWLVCGGAGFIGSNFVQHLLKRKDQVVVLDKLTYSGNRDNLPSDDTLGFRFVDGDIADTELVNYLLEDFHINVLINFAAESHVDNSIEDPDEFIATNVVGVYELLKASRRFWLARGPQHYFRFIQVSTDEVFGQISDDDPGFTEISTVQPRSPYSASKAAGDLLVNAWHKTYGLPTLVTNCGNNYGPKQHPEKLIPRIISCALAGIDLPIYGQGKNIRDWIHVDDHCRGLLLAAQRGQPGDAFCFGGRNECRNIDLVNRICRFLDEMTPRSDGHSYAEQIAFVSDRLGHDYRYAIDDTKAEKELGFTRTREFDEGLRSTIQWYLDHQHWLSRRWPQRLQESITEKPDSDKGHK